MIDAAVLTPRASEAPLQAQEAADGASAPGPGIRLVDLSDYPTHTTVDRFEVEVSNLTATVAYQVIVSSDSAGLGIGACGTASQTETVTGVAAQTLTFFLYVCTEDSGTLTAEVRRAGADSAEAVGQPAAHGAGGPRRGARRHNGRAKRRGRRGERWRGWGPPARCRASAFQRRIAGPRPSRSRGASPAMAAGR